MEIIVIASLVLGVLVLNRPVTALFQRLYTRQQFKKFIARETFYHSVVSRYFGYYNRLSLDEQRKFLFRTYQFQQSKHFHYIEVEANAEMPILVSAAAIQLTFGLEKFKLNYFDDIFILKRMTITMGFIHVRLWGMSTRPAFIFPGIILSRASAARH